MKITRIWRGVVKKEHAEVYRKYVEETGIKYYQRVPGNISAKILVKTEGNLCHIVTISEWNSLADIKKFAGDDCLRARYFEEDKKYLLKFEEFVEHFDTYSYERS